MSISEFVSLSALLAVEGAPSFSVDALLGPFALLVAALIAVGVLWREDRRVYRERIADLTGQRDRAEAREEVATTGWKTQTDANALLAADVAGRRRSSDGK
jgi:hypothetical protein